MARCFKKSAKANARRPLPPAARLRSLGAPEIKEIKFFKMCLLDGHFCGV
jgi:hypothetical protein